MESEDAWGENDGEDLEAEIMRADHAFGVDLRGTTEAEALAGPSLDQVVDDRVPDLEGELVAEGFVVRDDFVSPEESASRSGQMRQVRRITTIRILNEAGAVPEET